MEPRPLIYDLTRLSGRLLSPTPGGIDRMDFAFARHFLGRNGPNRAVSLSLRGPALFASSVSADVLESLTSTWDPPEPGANAADRRFDTLRKVENWLAEEKIRAQGTATQRIDADRPRRNVKRALGAYFGLATRGQPLRKRAPENSIYLNVSQFPLWNHAYFRWLDERPDIDCVAMIHDLLPLQYPEYFLAADRDRHEKRLAFLARRGTAAIVSTSVVEQALRDHLRALGRRDLPILTAHLPVDSAFSAPVEVRVVPAARQRPYFVVCGTIEPRKNHLLLLNVWRELAEQMGASAPRLIIVGRRGWEIESVIDLLERCERLSPHVLEVNGLSTLELRALIAGAVAVLSPSFSEGFGLPVAEAIAGGVPVIASDIPVFREIGGPDVAYAHPLDGPGWRRAIQAGLDRELPRPAPRAFGEDDYFRTVEGFLASL